MTKWPAIVGLGASLCAAQEGTPLVPPVEPQPQSHAHARKMLEVDMALKPCDTAGALARLDAPPKPMNPAERFLEDVRRADMVLADASRADETLERYVALAAMPDLAQRWAQTLARRIEVLQFLTARYAEMSEQPAQADPLRVARLLELGRKDEALAALAAGLAQKVPKRDTIGRKRSEILRQLQKLAADPATVPGAYAKLVVESMDPLSSIRLAANPVLISHPTPMYPRIATRDGIEGFVTFELLIDDKGVVQLALPIDASPKGVFERSAEPAVMASRYVPAYRHCQPVPTKAIRQILFRLDPYSTPAEASPTP